MMTLPILYLDSQLVVVNKPSGLLVHRTALDAHETENAMHIVRDQLGQWVYPFHRLDKATSGVLIFALDQETARLMTQSFTEKNISKQYLAIVRGFTKEEERIDHPLKEQSHRKAHRDTNKDKPAQQAITEYRQLATIEIPGPVGRYDTARYSYVSVTPFTGRNHQIRRHMKHIFHPVINDTTYGDGKQNDFFRRVFGCRRLLLHCQRMTFLHPWADQELSIHAPLDATFVSLLKVLKWDKVDIHT